jgi:hypothetical protein
VRELFIGGDKVEGGDVVSIRTQPIRDGKADTRTASGDDGRLHLATPVSVVKNLPSDYENRTLALCRIARHIDVNCRIRFGANVVFRPHD